MELYGYRRKNSRCYYVPLNIHIPQFNIFKPITFLVDSIYNLDFHSSIVNMKPTSRSRTAAGATVNNVVLNDCVLYYYYGPNRSVHYEKLDQIHVSRPREV
jgi:hypothetical protein